MNAAQKTMFTKGQAHFASGKSCTPFDCQAVDAALFVEMKSMPNQAAYYNLMRGAFNKGWCAAHAESFFLAAA